MQDVAPSELFEAKLHPPTVRPAMVPRPALVERLNAARDVPVVAITAPPGYGKTTLLAQWAERNDRIAWVSLDERDNDPAVLLTYVAAALNHVETVDPELFRALDHPGVFLAGRAVPRFTAALSSMKEPIALVLDHTELIQNQQCLDTIAELALNLPAGCQLVVASRVAPPVPTRRLRPRGDILEFGVGDLAMDDTEARALLAGAGVELGEAETADLIARTEGWPVGLYLAAIALKAGGSCGDTNFAFGGDDRHMADYLRAEFLARLSRGVVSFLTRTSMLERVNGPLCDAVLDITGSADILESLEASNLLLVALDRKRHWYRYHRLFHDLLRSELERREPELVSELHARASVWYEANAMPEPAIEHAQLAGDADRVAQLVTPLVTRTWGSGRVETVERWLNWFAEEGHIDAYPAVAVHGATMHALLGRPAGAERWAAAAERATSWTSLPDASTPESWLAQLRTIMCRNGTEELRRDAKIAQHGLAPGNPMRATAFVVEGLALLLEDHADAAEPVLGHALEVATSAQAWAAGSVGAAARAIIARDRSDWAEAEEHSDRALAIVREGGLEGYGSSALGYVVAASISAHRGDVPTTKELAARAARLRPLLTYAVPHLSALTFIELAAVYLNLADPSGARAVLRDARDILQQRPQLGTLPRRCAELEAKIDLMRTGTIGASALTGAELRLLPMLSTHLTFREIGERLHVSRHTIKTQAMSVYQKLGVSSRSDAISKVRELGLLAG